MLGSGRIPLPVLEALSDGRFCALEAKNPAVIEVESKADEETLEIVPELPEAFTPPTRERGR